MARTTLSRTNLGLDLAMSGPFDPTAMTLAEAKAAWNAYRLDNGYAAGAPILTAPDGNPKLLKSAKAHLPTYGISLAPYNVSGFNVCPWSTKGCRATCLATAGKGGMPTIERARVMKTRFLAENPQAFVTLVWHELRRAVVKWERIGFRPNVLADLPWHLIAPALFQVDGVVAYDYTKDWAREAGEGYHLTYSWSERRTEFDLLAKVDAGHNVAVVFSTRKGEALPTHFYGVPVVDGDETDYRPADPRGFVVGLRAKGKARRPEVRGGFVVDVDEAVTSVTFA